MRFSMRFSRADLDNAAHVDAGQVHLIGIDLAWFDEFFDLGDADAPGHRGERREVAGGLVEDQVAVTIAAQRVDEREVGGDRVLEHELAGATLGVELAHLFRRRGNGHATRPVVPAGQAAFGHLGADAGLREERRDARPAGAKLLGERALRGELDLEFARQELPLELLVLADVRRGHLADAFLGEQQAEAPVIHPAVVADDAERPTPARAAR